MADPWIPVSEPLLDGNEKRYVLDALDSNWISSSGKYLTAFEETFARFCGASHGVACINGTAAIHLALAALKIGPGDEVIAPDFNLIVAANMIHLTGARAVFVDVDRATWCLDPARIEEKITPKTRAILVVHMYGHPADMPAILEIAGRRKLRVIEDGAQAHGSEVNGRRVGALGDAGCFSFYSNKNLTTGEGGMVVTRDAGLAERCRLLRNQAFTATRFHHEEMGFNYRLTNLQAAIGLAQVERAEEKIELRRRVARVYTGLLQGTADLTLPPEAPWARSTFWMYGILIGPRFGRSRDEVMKLLAERGIETRAFFHPMHRQPMFRGQVAGEFPVSADLGERGLYLPSGLGLTRDQQERVVKTLLDLRASSG